MLTVWTPIYFSDLPLEQIIFLHLLAGITDAIGIPCLPLTLCGPYNTMCIINLPPCPTQKETIVCSLLTLCPQDLLDKVIAIFWYFGRILFNIILFLFCKDKIVQVFVLAGFCSGGNFLYGNSCWEAHNHSSTDTPPRDRVWIRWMYVSISLLLSCLQTGSFSGISTLFGLSLLGWWGLKTLVIDGF